MNSKQQPDMWICFLGLLAAFLFLFASCSTWPKEKLNSASATDGKRSGQETPRYYDFGDILVPAELKLDAKTSFVYQSSGVAAGVLVFESKVEINSLIDFFENNMAKDNWQVVSTFKSPRTLLLFMKANRWCVINITDEKRNTHVEIWVAPTTGAAESGLLK